MRTFPLIGPGRMLVLLRILVGCRRANHGWRLFCKMDSGCFYH